MVGTFAIANHRATHTGPLREHVRCQTPQQSVLEMIRSALMRERSGGPELELTSQDLVNRSDRQQLNLCLLQRNTIFFWLMIELQHNKGVPSFKLLGCGEMVSTRKVGTSTVHESSTSRSIDHRLFHFEAVEENRSRKQLRVKAKF